MFASKRFSVQGRLASSALLVALILGAVACGEEQKPTPQPANLPPEQVIERAVPAIGAANSFHFTLETSKLQKPLPGLFITKADGDVSRPDKMAGNISATYSGLPINVKVVVDNTSQYWTDPTSGKWSTIPAFFNVAEFFSPSKGVADILANVKDLKGDGSESVNSTESYRLNGMVPASALKSLSPEVTATGDLTTTLWVGTSDFLLRRVRLEGPILSGEPADIARTITITDYNKAVKVETPVVK